MPARRVRNRSKNPEIDVPPTSPPDVPQSGDIADLSAAPGQSESHQQAVPETLPGAKAINNNQPLPSPTADNTSIWNPATRASAYRSVPNFKMTYAQIRITGADNYEGAKEIVVKTAAIMRRGILPDTACEWRVAMEEAIRVLRPFEIETVIEASAVLMGLISEAGLHDGAALLFSASDSRSHSYAAHTIERFARLNQAAVKAQIYCKRHDRDFVQRCEEVPEEDTQLAEANQRAENSDKIALLLAKAELKRLHGLVEVSDAEARSYLRKKFSALWS